MGLLNRFDPSRERLKLPNLKKPSGFLKNLKSITLTLPSLLVPTPFTKGGGGRADPPAISKTVAPMNVKFCSVLETPLKVSEMSIRVGVIESTPSFVWT